MTSIRWDKFYLQATTDVCCFVPAFQFPSCKSMFLSLRQTGMLNCEAHRCWRKGMYWEMRKLHIVTPRSCWDLYQINNTSKVMEAQDVEQTHWKIKNVHGRKVHLKVLSKMLLVNEHERNCLSDEQRKVEVADSITPSLGKQHDIQEFRWNIVPLGVSFGCKKSVEVGFLSKKVCYVLLETYILFKNRSFYNRCMLNSK